MEVWAIMQNIQVKTESNPKLGVAEIQMSEHWDTKDTITVSWYF